MTKVRARTAARSTRAIGSRVRNVLPLHHRIYIVLRRRLVEGVYAADGPMPGEHQLAAQFKASRVTIRRVLEQLRQENLIDRRHGVGTFPAADAAAVAASARLETSYYDYIAASSQTYDDALLKYELIAAPAALSQIGSFGERVLKIVRVAYLEKTPHHVLTTYVPEDLAARVPKRAIGNKTVLELLKKQGIVAEQSELRLGATAADTFEARHLRVAIGVPLVRLLRISRLAGGRAIEYSQILSIADNFGYKFIFDGRDGTVRLPPIKTLR